MCKSAMVVCCICILKKSYNIFFFILVYACYCVYLMCKCNVCQLNVSFTVGNTISLLSYSQGPWRGMDTLAQHFTGAPKSNVGGPGKFTEPPHHWPEKWWYCDILPRSPSFLDSPFLHTPVRKNQQYNTLNLLERFYLTVTCRLKVPVRWIYMT